MQTSVSNSVLNGLGFRSLVVHGDGPGRAWIPRLAPLLADGSRLKVPGVVPKLSDTPGDFDDGGPKLGEHTAEVLRSLGYDDAALADLRQRGVT